MNQSLHLSNLPWRVLTSSFKPSFAKVFLTCGFLASSLLGQSVQSAEVPSLASRIPTRQIASVAQAASNQVLENGTYLYGQSAQPEQIGSAYLVFEVEDSRVVGAFYMPQSSFDCFYGSIADQQLALNIVNSYERTVHPYAIALQESDSVATIGNPDLAPVGLEGYHRIETVSENDQRILSTCQADYQEL